VGGQQRAAGAEVRVVSCQQREAEHVSLEEDAGRARTLNALGLRIRDGQGPKISLHPHTGTSVATPVGIVRVVVDVSEPGAWASLTEYAAPAQSGGDELPRPRRRFRSGEPRLNGTGRPVPRIRA
jgi:hypothetical protein